MRLVDAEGRSRARVMPSKQMRAEIRGNIYLVIKDRLGTWRRIRGLRGVGWKTMRGETVPGGKG